MMYGAKFALKLSSIIRSPLQEIDVVDRGAVSSTKDRYDNGKSNNHLSRGHNQYEEDQNLPIDVAAHTGEGNERKVYGIEHQLDEHEDNDGIASHQGADDTYGEQKTGEH
jgi:hypothetical protein